MWTLRMAPSEEPKPFDMPEIHHRDIFLTPENIDYIVNGFLHHFDHLEPQKGR